MMMMMTMMMMMMMMMVMMMVMMMTMMMVMMLLMMMMIRIKKYICFLSIISTLSQFFYKFSFLQQRHNI
jgi:hypothetical protein